MSSEMQDDDEEEEALCVARIRTLPQTEQLTPPSQLPADTLDALQDFYRETDARQKEFEDLKEKAETKFDESTVSIFQFAEDWNASQFWYNDETAVTLANTLLKDASDSWIAVVSAPSVFVQMKKLLDKASRTPSTMPNLRLLEFDERFAVFKEFIKYDFSEPFRLPVELKGRFSRIICDPPFLSQDCQTRVALTARWLADPTIQPSERRLIVCTGAVMEQLVTKLYTKEGIRTTNFEPQHAKGLSNEFRCFANFETKHWQWKT